MLADGGTSLAALGVLRDQEAMFGKVASGSTAYRVIESIDGPGLERLRAAVAIGRSRAWELGATPKRVVLDWDATLVTAFSHKAGAAATYKKGFGHHPLLCYLDESREALAGVLREGNAGSNTAADHVRVGDLALAQLPVSALDGEIIARVDGAGATHEFTRWCRNAVIAFSVGAKLTKDVLDAALEVDDEAWKQGICKDGSENPDAFVCELTGLVNIDAWPERSRLICRAVRLNEAIQLTFGEDDGFRYEVFLEPDLVVGEALERQVLKTARFAVADAVLDPVDHAVFRGQICRITIKIQQNYPPAAPGGTGKVNARAGASRPTACPERVAACPPPSPRLPWPRLARASCARRRAC